MRINEYIKDRFAFLYLNLIIFLILTFVMAFLDIKPIFIFLVFMIWFTPLLLYMGIEFLKHRKYFKNMEETLLSLDKKYLLPEIMEKPNFLEGALFYNILKECNKEMHEHVNHYKNQQSGYREYIETWVHEIKTPIASIMLMSENNKTPIMDNIGQEVKKVESFVEQALYYARSNDVNKDYIIKKFSLLTAVNSVIRQHSKDFIYKRISLQLEELEVNVYSDIKWVEFILHQILSNSLKYIKPQEGNIRIYATKFHNTIVLTLEDNGIGISEKDLSRVFDKGFTGEQGRQYNAATGMGLYLCKKLSLKLGLDIKISSQLGIGTKVNVIFPVNDYQLEIKCE